MRTKSNRNRFGIFALILVLAGRGTHAAEIKGTVRSVGDGTAAVTIEGELAPNIGDKAEIFFSLAGTDVSVATASVTKVESDAVQLKIENASGDVAKDQLVRITSANPQKREAASPSATSNVFPSPIPVTTPDVGTGNALKKKSLPPSPPSPSPRNQAKATPKPSATATPAAQEKKRFAGRWRVLNENPSYTLVLSQNGNKVTGTYDLQDGSLSGEVHGDILVARWLQTGNGAAGAVRLKLSNDGEILSGPWTYDAASLSRGFTGEGIWTLRRIGASR